MRKIALAFTFLAALPLAVAAQVSKEPQEARRGRHFG